MFNDVNHYLIRQYFIYLAKDKFYPSYNGKIANFRFLTCQGAYDEKFPVTNPPKTPIIEPPKPPVPEPEPVCVEGAAAVIDAASDKPAVADVRVT